jgi:drug/metabolite transporter (DMT)-like permease
MPDSRLILCVAVALAGALAFAAATVAQQRAAARSSDAEARGAGFVGQLLRRPQWWVGTLGNGAGYLLQAVALGLGALVVVAPLMVTSLLFALPLGAWWSRRKLAGSAWVWGIVLSAALALFVLLGHPADGVDRGSLGGWLVIAAVGVPVVAGCLVLAHARSGAARASLLAVAVGVLAGALAVLTKTVVTTVPLGVGHLLAAPETYALVLVGLGGVYLQQLAFQAGALQASLPVMTVLEPVVGGLLGVALLHEHLHTSAFTLAVLVLAVAAMTLAAIRLARGGAQAAGRLA